MAALIDNGVGFGNTDSARRHYVPFGVRIPMYGTSGPILSMAANVKKSQGSNLLRRNPIGKFLRKKKA